MPTQAEQVAATLAVLEAQAEARQVLTAAATAVVAESVLAFNDWYDTPKITKWSAGVAAAVQAYQRQAASTTNAYLTRLGRLLSGRNVRAGQLIDVTNLRRGVQSPAVYGRVADAYRFGEYKATGFESTQLIRLDPDLRGLITPDELLVAFPNVPLEQPGTALEAASLRASQLVDTDVSLAVRDQADLFVRTSTPRPIGWRRMIHPELSKGGTCGLCIVASHREYGRATLLPIHNLCRCDVAPLYGKADDPTAIINDADLKRFYKDAGSTKAADLKRTRYQVNEHGELGPQLSPAGDRFRTAKDADKAPPKPSREQSQKALKALEDVISRQRDPATANPKLQKMVAFNENRIAALRKQLA